MKTWLAALSIASLPTLALGQTAAPPRPRHAILLVIDGFSYLAPERVDMPNLKALMARALTSANPTASSRSIPTAANGRPVTTRRLPTRFSCRARSFCDLINSS